MMNRPKNDGKSKISAKSKRQAGKKPRLTLQPNTTEEIYSNFKKSMEEDKFMLTKRLNSVLEQLEAAHREKEEVDRKLQEKSQTVLDLEKQIENNQFAKESLDSNLDLEDSKEREQHQLLK